MRSQPILVLLLAFLIASPAWGGMAAKRMMACMGTPCKAPTGTVNSINGMVGFTSSTDTPDTGTATPSTLPVCSGNITVAASCQGRTTGGATVYLMVNGVERSSLACGLGVSNSATLGATNVGGRYTVRVYADVTGDGWASANSFSLPVAQ